MSRLPCSGSGLGDWSLWELVGHTASSGLSAVPVALGQPAGSIEVASAADYWAFARTAPAPVVAAAIAASSADATAMADISPEEVNVLAGRATAALAAAGDDDLVTTAIGGMRVRDWIPTRTFELVVHGMDAAAAAGVAFDPPAAAVAEVTELAARVAVAVGDGPAVLRALTGRAALTVGYSII